MPGVPCAPIGHRRRFRSAERDAPPRRARRPVLLASGSLFLAAVLHGQSILTVAGGGTIDGRPATASPLQRPFDVVADSAGNLFIADKEARRVYRVSPSAAGVAVMTIYAGNGTSGFGGDGGPATAASIDGPEALALDAHQNLYIVEDVSRRVRRVDRATGIITTVAGGGSRFGDNVPATEANLSFVESIAIDPAGHLYITSGFSTVWKVEASTKILTRFAGLPSSCSSADGVPATTACLTFASAAAADPAGNIYVADRATHKVRKIDSRGIITTIAGTGTSGFSGDGGPATAAQLSSPNRLATDASSNVYVSVFGAGRVRRIAASTGIITTIAGNGASGFSGDGGPATSAALWWPMGMFADGKGTLYIADQAQRRIRAVAPNGIIATVAGNGQETGIIGDGGPAVVAVLEMSRGANAGFTANDAVAADPSGNVYIADTNNHVIRKVAARTGVITTVAGTGGAGGTYTDGGPAVQQPIGLIFRVETDPAGNFYTVFRGAIHKIDLVTGSIRRIAGGGTGGDGGPATQARINVAGFTVDGAGNVYICDNDSSGTQNSPNNRVRKVDAATGVISTIAGGGSNTNDGPATAALLCAPKDIAADAAGNLYIAECWGVRKLEKSSGNLVRIAGKPGAVRYSGDGGPATSAEFNYPTSIGIDGAGNVFVMDTGNYRVRRIDAATGIITTVAGAGPIEFNRGSYAGDEGPATAATFALANGIAVSSGGDLYIADVYANRIRAVFACGSVAIPPLASPGDGSTGVSLSPRLAWNRARSAFRYDVYLDTVNSPRQIAAADIATTTYSPANLEPATRYDWQIVAKGDPFCKPLSTSASPVRSFTTANRCRAPGAVDLTSPSDGATGVASSATLSWQASDRASTYDLYLGPSDPPPLRSTALTSTSFQATSLAPGTTYSWRVVARAACDPTRITESPTRSFRTEGSCRVPGSFTLLTPASGASGVSIDATLAWSAASDAAAYDVYLGIGPDPPLHAANVVGTSLALSKLIAGATYFWRIVARASCDPSRSIASPTSSFHVSGACVRPGAPTIVFAPSQAGVGQTYSIVWREASGAGAGASYVVERSNDSSFATITDRQETTSTAASFVTAGAATYFHRVRAIAECDPSLASANSPSASVTLSAGSVTVIFSTTPRAVVAPLFSRIEDLKTRFTLENIGRSPVQVLVARQELNSLPFFTLADPAGGDASFLTLEPRVPKTLEIRFSGPPNNVQGSYQGLIYVAGTGEGLAVNPFAYVSLKIGGNQSPPAQPVFLSGGIPTEHVFFPPAAGDDSSRPPITVDILNGGTTAMNVSAEIGPELWLKLEKDWNLDPIDPNSFLAVRLYSQRNRAPNGSALPRYTYLTVRTADGKSSRLLVEDNTMVAVAGGRAAPLEPGERSLIVPLVVSRGREAYSRLWIGNSGTDAVQVELLFTPAGSDGFGAAVRRASFLIPPNDLLVLTDPLSRLLGLTTTASGQIEIRASPERIGLLTVGSSIDAPRSEGTFRQRVPILVRGEGARTGFPHVVSGIVSRSGVRTRLMLMETSGRDSAVVRLVLIDRSSVHRGARTITVPRHGVSEINDLVPTAFDGGRIEVSVESGGGSVVALALVETTSGGSGAMLVSQPMSGNAAVATLGRATRDAIETERYLAPLVSGGSLKTALSLTGSNDSTTAFRLIWIDPQRGTSTRDVTVAPRQTSEWNDAALELFNLSGETLGSLLIETDARGKAFARLEGTTGETAVGDSLPILSFFSEAMTGAGSTTPLYADGIEHSVDRSRGTRSRLIITEVAGQTLVVTVRLYESGSRLQPLVEKDFTLTPRSQVVFDTLFSALGLDSDLRRKDRANVQCVVTAKSGEGLAAAVLMTTDNRSGDTKSILLVPAGGVPATGVQRTPPLVTTEPPPPTQSPGRRRAASSR